MGSNQSAQVIKESDDEDEEEDDDQRNINGERNRSESDNQLLKKVLEQEPEMLPCRASASPLSPQLSSLGTPRLGPSIKVWDPYNVLAPPPPPPPPVFSRSYSGNGIDDDQTVTTEVYVISEGECEMNLRPDLVGGRCPGAALTANGKRQARALAVFLKSQGVRFNAVFSSPLDRARSTAVSVCKEINFPEEQIQSSDALEEMSLGNWEGCSRSDIYTSEILNIIDRLQPDFTAPSGESLRQVEFRMIHFLNGILGLPEKLRLDLSTHQNDSHAFAQHSSHSLSNSVHEQDGSPLHPTQWDLLHRHHRSGLSRKKSGKSRLQFVTTTGDEIEDEMSPIESNHHQNSVHNSSFSSFSSPVSHVGVFTHSVPIKCLLTGILGCSPLMSHKICIDDSSVTVLQHSLKTGWQIKKLNDTAHLRLL